MRATQMRTDTQVQRPRIDETRAFDPIRNMQMTDSLAADIDQFRFHFDSMYIKAIPQRKGPLSPSPSGARRRASSRDLPSPGSPARTRVY